MIIYYDKATGEIFGVLDGRVHGQQEINNVCVRPSNFPKNKVGKYVVPFKGKFRIEKRPKTEMRVVDKKTMRVEKVVVGTEMVKVGEGMEPDIPFAEFILDVESGKERIYDYKIELDKSNKVVGFIKK